MKKELYFSQRYGYTKVDDTIQIESINKELRVDIWNFTYNKIIGLISIGYYNSFFSKFYTDFIRIPIDEIRQNPLDIKEIIMNNVWYRVYDLLEFINNAMNWGKTFEKGLNEIFEKENAGYRFIDGKIAPITQKEEIKTIEDAINNSNDNGIKEHLQKALTYLSDRTNPDYRNSIKESISAVGVYCRKLTAESTLDKAFVNLKKKGFVIPTMLQTSMEKLYFFTNGKDGIRHELMNDGNGVEKEEAYFMLVACSNFINYLKIKESKIGK